jgi:hypothetical protein
VPDDGSNNHAAPPSADRPAGDGNQRDFDLIRYGRWVVATIATIVAGIALARETHLRALTQHGIIVPAVLLLGAEFRRSPDSPREAREQLGWLAAWIAVGILCGITSPSIKCIVPSTALLWWYAYIQCECDTNRVRGGGAPLRSLLALRTQLKSVVHWRTAGVAFPAAVATIAALATSAGGFFSVVAEPHHRTKTASNKVHGGSRKPSTPSKQPPKKTPAPPKEYPAGARPEEHREPTPLFTCPYPEYPSATWAVRPIQMLLRDTLRWLGEPYEGCVESLNTEYQAEHGFVWGVGKDPKTGQALSAVIASYGLPEPSLYLAPAIPSIERLIRIYHFLSGPKGWPHYDAGEGDFYLVNTFTEGTCVLIRDRSGNAHEDLPFTILYPSVATAWALIIRRSEHWQWPTELPGRNHAGEVVFELSQPGDSISDAEITFNTKTFTATWRGSESYKYHRSQNDIAPAELEQDVRNDL